MPAKKVRQLSDSDAAALAISRIEGRLDQLAVALGAFMERSDDRSARLLSISSACLNEVMTVKAMKEELALNFSRLQRRMEQIAEGTPAENQNGHG